MPEAEFSPGLAAALENAPQGTQEALSFLAQGRYDEAEQTLLERQLQTPESCEVQAALGLLYALMDRPAEARRWVARACEMAGKAWWPRALAGVLAQREGALELAREAFNAALQIKPEPSVLILRARTLSDLGFVAEAVADMDSALELAGESAEHLVERARFHMARRKHEAALKDLEAAIKLEPKNAAYRALRSDLFLMLGSLEEAQADADGAARLAPQDEFLTLARIRLLLMRGKTAAARTALNATKTVLSKAVSNKAAKNKNSPEPKAELMPEREFLSVYADMKEKRFAQAAEGFFALCEGASDSMGMKARFYALLSRAADPAFRKRHKLAEFKAKKGGLTLLGLGLFPPYDATMDAVPALADADILFNNLPHTEVREVLHAFQNDIVATTYDAAEDEFLWADRMFAELKKNKAVTFVTRGHPLMFGRLACECVRRAKKQGVLSQVFGPASSAEVLLARSAAKLGTATQGYQVQNLTALETAKTVNTSVPMILNFYYGLTGEEVAQSQALLEKHYGPSHPVLMYGPKYDTEAAFFALGELKARYPEVHASLILYIPANTAVEPAKLPSLKVQKPGGRLIMAGLGVFGPDTAPMDALHLFARSHAVFAASPDKRTAPFLKDFTAKAVVASSKEEVKLAEAALKSLAQGKTVAVSFHGFPSVVSPAAAALMRRALEAGLPIDARWSPSIHGAFLARWGIGIGDHIQGLQCLTHHSFDKALSIDTSQPVIVSCWHENSEGKTLLKALKRFYPEEHPCSSIGPDYDTPKEHFPLSALLKCKTVLANTHIILEPLGGLIVPEDMVPGMPAMSKRRRRKDA